MSNLKIIESLDKAPTEIKSENRYRKERDKDYNKLQEQISTPEGDESKGGDPVSNHDWEKRYRDLRSYASRRDAELQAQIEELKSVLDKASEAPVKYPMNEEEFSEWVQKYPNAAKMFETMVMKKLEDSKADVKRLAKDVEAEKARLQFDRVYAKLLMAHPDFDTIRESDHWKGWLAEQPKGMVEAIDRPNIWDETCVRDAARVIELYKKETKGSKSSKPVEDGAGAAMKVARNSGQGDLRTDDSSVYSESQIAKMSSSEFAKHQDKILEAQRNGKFVYDVSGAAR